MELKECLNYRAALVAETLTEYVSEADDDFGVIYDAMRYSLLIGGKRLRPFLTLEFAGLAAELAGASPSESEKRALPYAAAIEMLHTYSLIHDDLPCMDNDDLRRGKPTNHRVFGEANALLAGDALLTKAFEVASENPLTTADANCRAVSLLARAAGASGMIGGQVLDLIGEKTKFGRSTLEKLQSLKTGELINCACMLGITAGFDTVAVSPELADGFTFAARNYAYKLGRAFQVTDDILDVIGDEKTLGKPVGSDAESGKTTFATIMPLDEAEALAKDLTDEAVEAISVYPGSERLCELAKSLIGRKN